MDGRSDDTPTEDGSEEPRVSDAPADRTEEAAREESRSSRPLLDPDSDHGHDNTDTPSEGPWVDRSVSPGDRESSERPATDDADDADDPAEPTDLGGGTTDAGIDAAAGFDGPRTDRVEADELDTGARGVLGRLSRALGAGRQPGFADTSYDPDAHGPLATFDVGEGHTERDRYWVNRPYALVAITTDPAANDLQYRVVEPTIGPVERTLLGTLEDDIRDSLLYRTDLTDEANPESVLRRELDRRLAEYDVPIDARRFEVLYYYLWRGFLGYGRIDPFMHDPHVEDVSCDGYDLPIFVYHDEYGNVGTNVTYPEGELDDFVVRLAQRSGRHVSLGRPVVEATLPDGSRAELALGTEVTPRGSAFTIRRYAEDPFTPLDLIENGTMSTEQMAYLWLCIEHDRNLLFAGGTASGKTTAMNAVSMFVPPRAKVLSIEDTRELALYHDNWLSSVTRERFGGETDVTMYDLLRSALRHRPEYIVVGEVRGKEAMTLFQAMNTGHTTYSTMHADSIRTVINRLENEPINVPRQMVQSLDVLCVQGFANVAGERVRRTKRIAEISGIDERTGELDYSTAFEWRPQGDTHTEQGSGVTEAIREGMGWSRTDLLRELKRRRTFLTALRENGVADYRRFTAAVRAYYADPERAMADIESGIHPGSDTTARFDEDTAGDAVSSDSTADISPAGSPTTDDGASNDEYATDDEPKP